MCASRALAHPSVTSQMTSLVHVGVITADATNDSDDDDDDKDGWTDAADGGAGGVSFLTSVKQASTRIAPRYSDQ